jgi:hypothetical protein
MACPFTNGSFGSCISRGVISVDDGFLDEVVREARVLDRGRKGDDVPGEAGTVEDDPENAGCDGDRVVDASEAAEWERDEMGTIKFCRFWAEA